MQSVVQLDIDAPQATVAELFADPAMNPRWMEDVARIEPVSGELGQVGSVYRMVPKQGPVFTVTVIARELPEELQLSLESPGISVAVRGQLIKLSERRTRLVSEENFAFDGVFNKVSGFLAQQAIKAAHRRHMKSFKHFAENQR